MLNLRSRKYYIWVIKTEFELAQPVGVGYSYTEKGDKGVWTTEAAAKDVSGGRLSVFVDQIELTDAFFQPLVGLRVLADLVQRFRPGLWHQCIPR